MGEQSGAENPTDPGRQARVDGLHPLLGRAIRGLRTERGWRQEDLADRANQTVPSPGLTRNAVSQIEIGNRAIDLNELLAILLAFRVSLVDLFNRLEEDEPAVYTQTLAHTTGTRTEPVYVTADSIRRVLFGRPEGQGPTWNDVANTEARVRAIAEEVAREVTGTVLRQMFLELATRGGTA